MTGDQPTTAVVLTSYVGTERSRLEAQRRVLQAGDPEGVHQLRVSARRIRSALATYAPVLQRETTEPLRKELAWFGGVLGRARDAQVQRERLEALVDAQDDDLVLGPVRSRLSDELRSVYEAELVTILAMLDGARFTGLLDTLDALTADPPVRAEAASPATHILPRLLRLDLERLRRRHAATMSATDAVTRAEALHEVRKAAKRLRYAAEGATPVLGTRAALLAGEAEAVQDLLGEHQDTVVARSTLHEVGAHLSGEVAFTFGRLHALEEERALALEARYPEVYAALPEPRELDGWT